ncbi:hypothetical protein [Oscillatoria acuminata]|uniref:Uncharacterized protein n=1 Tax=Oscillatoria acuminata PCC 6304 TaxID=56110 RepID=K9TNW3_9CYAN|nr:hypothetical protein [Oscillatoria acuminata]AFY83816.1 hypothetical protein Oscil6304_4290 [Oscillatoria acuminata PCC 6304]
MLDWFTKNKKGFTSSASQENAVLRVIGDRASGKTTFMASLARWPNADPSSPVQNISAINEEGNELISQAQNILEQGLELEPSDLSTQAQDVKDYSISITLKGKFSLTALKPTGRPLVTLAISCKDYAGEFFSDLIHLSGDLKLQDYLEDCLQASGLVFLLDGTSYRKDVEYANGLDKFLIALDRTDIGGSKRRIALVLTKCEQPELWVRRHEPEYLASCRFPLFYQKLQSWQKMGGGSVDYFTTSAFGMLGSKYPEPNSQVLSRDRSAVRSVIKDPKRWRPFGLVAPIYWLCTGERHKELDQD